MHSFPVRLPAHRLRLAALLLLLISSVWAGPVFAQDEPDPTDEDLSASERLEALIERIKLTQSQLVTMEADFEQHKESQLLLEPEVSTGHFWYHAPDRVRWSFASPTDTLVAISGGSMLTWYRDLNRAERVDIGKQADRVMEYLSASNSLETLQRYFSVRVTFPQNDGDPYSLQLDPRFDRVAQRIEQMAIRLHPEGFYPLYLKYVEPDGDVTEFTFENILVNEEIADETFQIELPDDVEVRTVELGRGEGG
ncbi:MAG: outer membrane lipoprotein carrier protein LolA [Thermoanaerobaculia bacterium]|nr:outer membrane lipoprotein carrier protein LolA [Thermoanaerobaculia bacterium]